MNRIFQSAACQSDSFEVCQLHTKSQTKSGSGGVYGGEYGLGIRGEGKVDVCILHKNTMLFPAVVFSGRFIYGPNEEQALELGKERNG